VAGIPPVPFRDSCHDYGIINGMRTTIDRSGRLVIPRSLRAAVGLTSGEVEIWVDGAGIKVEPVPGQLVEVDGHLRLAPGLALSDDELRALRHDYRA